MNSIENVHFNVKNKMFHVEHFIFFAGKCVKMENVNME